MSVDIKELFEAGAHFGHRTSRWHPKMAPYIHSKRGDTHIINLEVTANQLDEALKFITETTSQGKQVLLVGTKRQSQDITKNAAETVNMPFVTVRWLGGMLTNHKTIFDRVKHLKKLEERMESGELASRYNKREVLEFQEEINSLNTVFGGIKNLNGLPGAVFVSDCVHDNLAVKEARRLNIPVVGIVDTNADPSEIDYPIAANDDAIKTVSLITDYIVQAIQTGQGKIKKAAPKPEAAEKPKSGAKAAPKKEEKADE